MACCGAGNHKAGQGSFPTELFRLLVDCLLSVLTVLAIHVAVLFSREAARRRGELTAAVVGSLQRSAAALLDTPFLVNPRYRCRVTGRLYPVSGALAGFLYRWFNVLVFGGFLAAISSALLVASEIVE